MKITRRTYVAALFLAILVLFARRPDAFTMPQFWAEDGAIWYADAYNLGWTALVKTQDGYFSSSLRILGALEQLVPLQYAPLLSNVGALLCTLLPVGLLLSARFKKIIPDDRVRLLLAALYVFAPNTWESRGNATNMQWYLGLAAFMVLVSEVSRTRLGKILDAALVALSGLSGPFAVFLSPIAAIMWWRERKAAVAGQPSSPRWRRALLLVTAATALVQCVAVFAITAGSRLHRLPEFRFDQLVLMLMRQVVLHAVPFGIQWPFFASAPAMLTDIPVVALFLIACGLVAYAAVRGPLALRLFLLFVALDFGAALLSPNMGPQAMALPDYPHLIWEALTVSGFRYFLLPILAYQAVLVWCLRPDFKFGVRASAAVLLFIQLHAMIIDFRYPSFPDTRFPDQVRMFNEKVPSGQTAAFSLTPAGWMMVLVKK